MKTLNKPIEMIAVYDQEGKIKPIRFRVVENEELKVFNVKGIKHISEEKIGNDKVRKFICLIEVNEVQTLVEIVYNINNMKWFLYKM